MSRHDFHADLTCALIKEILELRQVVKHREILPELHFAENSVLSEINLLVIARDLVRMTRDFDVEAIEHFFEASRRELLAKALIQVLRRIQQSPELRLLL